MSITLSGRKSLISLTFQPDRARYLELLPSPGLSPGQAGACQALKES